MLDLTASLAEGALPEGRRCGSTRRASGCRASSLFYLPSGKAAREVHFTKFRKVAGQDVVAEMEIQDLLRAEDAGAVTRLEYLDIQPAKIDDTVFTPEGARDVLSVGCRAGQSCRARMPKSRPAGSPARRRGEAVPRAGARVRRSMSRRSAALQREPPAEAARATRAA